MLRRTTIGGLRPVTLALLVLCAAVVGLAAGRFLLYSDAPTVPLPTVVVPDDTEVRQLQAAADTAPEDPDIWQALGIAATEQAIATADPAWYAVAEEALATAAELDPDDPLTTIATGQLALSLHDFDRALQLGLDATAAVPDNATARGVLVDAQVELGDYDAAADSLQMMLEVDPDLAALSRASYLRQLNGDLDGAVIALRQAVTASGTPVAGAGAATGDLGRVSALLGEVLLHRGDLDGARQAYTGSATPAAAAGLARIAAAQGDLDGAEQILTDLVQRTPAPPVIVALAEVQRRAGDTDGLAETVQLARTVATLQESAGQTVDLELALFEASFGDPGRAVQLATVAHDARPDNVFADAALAWAHHRAGNAEQARDHATDAVRLGTVDTAHELRMAEILGEGRGAVLDRNPLAEELFVP